jgi:SAM-dependent methyltransferase
MAQTYAIRGGQSGRERLRLLSHVLQAGTFDFLDKVGVRPRMVCLDAGCGGGDVTRELARRVGAAGRVVGLDMDAAQLQIVRAETAGQNIDNIDYRVADVTNPPSDLENFDLVYTRFLLSHLGKPAEVLSWMVKCSRCGGVLVVEDVDLSGYFCYPPLPAFDRYVALVREVMLHRGGDPLIGLKLPRMLIDAGLSIGGMAVAQPSDIDGDVKFLNALTMENIADAAVNDNLATRDEVEQLIETLHQCARDERSFASVTRRIQVWGRRPQ